MVRSDHSQEKGKEGKETGCGNSSDDETDFGQQGLKESNPYNTSGDVSDGAADELQYFLALMSQDEAKDDPNELEDAWAGRVEKTGLIIEPTNSSSPTATPWLKLSSFPPMSFNRAQLEAKALRYCCSLRPELEDFLPDKRPTFNGFRGQESPIVLHRSPLPAVRSRRSWRSRAT